MIARRQQEVTFCPCTPAARYRIRAVVRTVWPSVARHRTACRTGARTRSHCIAVSWGPDELVRPPASGRPSSSRGPPSTRSTRDKQWRSRQDKEDTHRARRGRRSPRCEWRSEGGQREGNQLSWPPKQRGPFQGDIPNWWTFPWCSPCSEGNFRRQDRTLNCAQSLRPRPTRCGPTDRNTCRNVRYPALSSSSARHISHEVLRLCFRNGSSSRPERRNAPFRQLLSSKNKMSTKSKTSPFHFAKWASALFCFTCLLARLRNDFYTNAIFFIFFAKQTLKKSFYPVCFALSRCIANLQKE